jgi:hypothetical protein
MTRRGGGPPVAVRVAVTARQRTTRTDLHKQRVICAGPRHQAPKVGRRYAGRLNPHGRGYSPLYGTPSVIQVGAGSPFRWWSKNCIILIE